jgi:diguanylate cyclase (GGDEF)-like protein
LVKGVRGLACLLASGAAPLPAEAPGDARRPGLVSFQRVAVPEDSPASLCTSLAQDRDGFLWLGTQDGLVRYDGYDFRTHRADPADPRRLAGSYVRALLAASDGRLWVGTFDGGVSVRDPRTGDFTTYRRGSGGLSHDRVEGLAEDREQRIWVATGEGLDRIDRDGRVTSFRHDPEDPRSLAHDKVSGLLVDRSGRLYVGGRDGLQVRDETGFTRVASEPGRDASLAGEYVVRLLEDGQGRIWVGTAEHGAAVLDPRTGALRRLRPRPEDPAGLSHFWVYGFAEATPEEMWIATFGGGVDVVHTGSFRVLDRLRTDATVDATIGGDRVGAVLKDRSGLLWVGTWGQGLARHDPTTRAFLALRSSPLLPEGLSHPGAVRTLPLPDGTVWVGTNGNGIDVLGPDLRLRGGIRPDPTRPGALGDGAVTCLARAPDGAVFAATLNGDLHRRRPGEARFDRVTPGEGLAGGPIRALEFGPDGVLWAGSSGGLTRIDPHSLETHVHRHDPRDPATLTSNTVEALAFTAEGLLWIGTDSGLNAFDPRTGRARRVVRDAARPDGLPHDWVPDLAMVKGRLWVATQGGAAVLRSFDGSAARFDHVADRCGREPEPVRSIVEDAQGAVWLGPRLRVDPEAFRCREFSGADGAALGNFYFASRARGPDGSLFFGSPEGLLVVRPSEIQEWTFAPPVVVTSARIAGKEASRFPSRAPLRLPPGARSLALDFAALDLSAPARLLYRHRLEGFDAAWIDTDASHRSASYTNLPPGSYTLRIQGSNRAGVMSPHELQARVEVPAAFTETRAYRALVGLLAGAVAYGLYRLRVRTLDARRRELERVVHERTEELRAAYQRIEEVSLRDPLTGLRNRRFLEQTVESDVERCLRRQRSATPESDLLFFLLDLDRFKSVNDTHGHGAGDAVLVGLAALFRETFRASDHLVRWGGEEFLLVAPFTDRARGAELAEKLRAAVAARPFPVPGGATLRVTASIGWSAFPFGPGERSPGWETVVDVADRALYAAKHSGRNRWVGVVAADGKDAAGAARGFLEDPAAAVVAGSVRVATRRDEAVDWPPPRA